MTVRIKVVTNPLSCECVNVQMVAVPSSYSFKLGFAAIFGPRQPVCVLVLRHAQRLPSCTGFVCSFSSLSQVVSRQPSTHA